MKYLIEWLHSASGKLVFRKSFEKRDQVKQWNKMNLEPKNIVKAGLSLQVKFMYIFTQELLNVGGGVVTALCAMCEMDKNRSRDYRMVLAMVTAMRTLVVVFVYAHLDIPNKRLNHLQKLAG